MNVSISPDVLFAKYGQKCIEVDALRERIIQLEQLLEAQRGVAAHNKDLDPINPTQDAYKEDLFNHREHTNGV